MLNDLRRPRTSGGRGALVISLDLELAWGVFDSINRDGSYHANLMGARNAIPRILELFAENDIAATWATVGMLFAESRDEALAFSPQERPHYVDPRLDAYRVQTGQGERDDPVHFAPSLIREIAATPRQEIGSHTFSHYYCLEPGQTAATFEADLRAAKAIAAAKGITLDSLVVPRHQVRSDYLPVIASAGFRTHRTNEVNYLGRPRARSTDPMFVRGLRMLDSYMPLTGANLVPWAATAPDHHGLVDVRESRFLRPVVERLRFAEPLRVNRIAAAMEAAAKRGEICHIWWHPHNFGARLEENMANLRAMLGTYRRLHDAYGLASLGMHDVATLTAAGALDQSNATPRRERSALERLVAAATTAADLHPHARRRE